jgi:hypothetical protein
MISHIRNDNMATKSKLQIKGVEIQIYQINSTDYISITDIAKYKNMARTNYIIQNWMRNRNTIEFLGLWERINNPNFKGIEFDAFKNLSGSNSFSLTPKQWLEKTGAIGLTVNPGRYGGGVFAHKDIAFEFATWISPEFKLFLIKEFQRLKDEEDRQKLTGWNVSRILSKLNYRIHTDAIKHHLIPPLLRKDLVNKYYADEADLLNVCLFGQTAKEWGVNNNNMKGNIRDHASIEQLVVLSNLESLNAEFIKAGLSQKERILKLNAIAISQMGLLIGSKTLNKLS